MTICTRHCWRALMAETFAPEMLLNTVDAARRLGVSPSFLAKARMEGKGPRYPFVPGWKKCIPSSSA